MEELTLNNTTVISQPTTGSDNKNSIADFK